MIKEFRDFLLRGNIIELAVAFVIGAAFALVVKSFNDNIITPIIAMLGGKPDFSGLYFTINGAQFRWGAFLTDLLGFVITAAAVFLLVVKPVNALMARRKTEPPIDATTRDCPYCLSQIPIGASRCAFCTQEVGAPA